MKFVLHDNASPYNSNCFLYLECAVHHGKRSIRHDAEWEQNLTDQNNCDCFVIEIRCCFADVAND